MCTHTHEYAYSRYRSSIDIVVPSMFLFNSVRKYIGDMYLYVYIIIYVCVCACVCVCVCVCVNLNLSSPMNICNMGRSSNSTG